MVYITSWQEYQEAAEGLYERSPNNAWIQTRYCVKWRASSNKLVLKITDNATCLKFKTHSSIFLNRFEALNLSLMEKMQNRRRSPKRIAPLIEHPKASPEEEVKPASAVPNVKVVPTSPSGPASDGVKKKKPKKKK